MSELSLSPVLTSAGLAAVAAAHGQGLQAKITHIALGDGGYAIRDASDAPLTAAQARTVMQSEQVRVGVYAGAIPGPQQIVVEARIDAGKPNFWVKEVGFFLEDGTLFAIWSSDTLNLGFRGDLVPWVFRFALAWTQLPENAVTVEFSGDAGYSDLWSRLNDHITSKDPHPSQIEPAFRTDCEPCLLEFAERGESLPAPFVFSRGGKSAPYINALGHRAWTGPDEMADDFDPVTLGYKGKRIDAYTTTTYLTRQMWSGAVPGVIGEGGALPTGWTLSNTGNIQTEVIGTGYDEGFRYLDVRFFGTPTTPVFRLANPNIGNSAQGEKWTCQLKAKAVAGSFNNIDKIGIGVVEAIGPHVGTYDYLQKERSEDFQQIFATRTIVETSPSLFCWFAVFVPSNNPIDITLRVTEPQVEKSSFPGRFVGADTDGASAVLTADVLTIGPVETDTVFEQDFKSSITGWSPVNDGVFTQDVDHGLVGSSPTTGAVIAKMAIPQNLKGKRVRALFHSDGNGYSRSLRTSNEPGAMLTSVYVSAGIAADLTIPHDAVYLQLRADGVPSNTDVYWADLKLTELVPFDDWDSNADGHTILMGVETPLTPAKQDVPVIMLDDSMNWNNSIRIYKSGAGGYDTTSVRVSAAYTISEGRIYPNPVNADFMYAISFAKGKLQAAASNGADILNCPVLSTPPGLCRLKICETDYIIGPVIFKRIAIYNRYLPEADLNAMVQK